MNKERSIIFNAPIVQAILDGKTNMFIKVLNREFNPVPSRFQFFEGNWYPESNSGKSNINSSWSPFKCPFGQINDTLWVKETWGHNGCLHCPIHYKASEPNWQTESYNPNAMWYSAVSMHRVDSRIDLKIENIRIERLQDITEEDAVKEGNKDKDSFIINFTLNNERKMKELNPFVWVIEFQRIEVDK